MKVGYAMYSARELCRDRESLSEVMHALADMGYDGVEMFLYYGVKAEELKEIAEECGLELIGTHVHKPRWDADTEGELIYAKEAGIPCLTFPYIAEEDRKEEVFSGMPAYLHQLADRCREYGIRLQYHNHDFEFKKTGGRTFMEDLIQKDDAYGIELDTFWADYTGIDVPLFLEQHRDRISQIHIKDYDGTRKAWPELPPIRPIGMGVVDNAAIIRAAERLGMDWVIVELDQSPLPVLESAGISMDYVKKILGRA